MKLLLMLISLLIAVSFLSSRQDKYPISRGEQLVNTTLGKTAQIIREKYHIKPCGAGASMPDGPIQELTLCFATRSSATKEQLRELVIKSARELLYQVAENNEMQQFLKERPFTIKNIQIIIFNHDKNGMSLQDPEIAGAEISQGNLIYRTNDPENKFGYKNQFYESYEEALKAM